LPAVRPASESPREGPRHPVAGRRPADDGRRETLRPPGGRPRRPNTAPETPDSAKSEDVPEQNVKDDEDDDRAETAAAETACAPPRQTSPCHVSHATTSRALR